MQRKTFHTPDGPIAYWSNDLKGESEPTLVFLPGLTADRRLFEKQTAYFENRRPCLVWDAPSHGASRPFPLTWSLDDLAVLLHRILEVEHIESPVIVGQSLGGCIAQAYMDLLPGEVKGFVSVDSCPLQREYYASWELSALKHTHAMYAAIPWKILLKWGAKGCAASDYGRRLMREMMGDYAKREYVDLAAHGYRALAEATEADRPYAVDCPSLLICGSKDNAGSIRRYNREWEKRTGVPVNWIEGAGHNSNTDCPDEVNRLIDSFAIERECLI